MNGKKPKHPLRQVREAIDAELGMSQDALASLVGCTRETINRIESGRLRLSDKMAERVDEVLGCSLQKWIALGQDSREFQLDKKKLIRNFALIRSYGREGTVPSVEDLGKSSLSLSVNPLFDSKPAVEGELLVPFRTLSDAAKAAIERLPSEFEKELKVRGIDKTRAQKYARDFLRNLKIECFCDYELSVFKKLAEAAVRKEKFLPFLWDFTEWADAENKKLGLGLISQQGIMDMETTGLLLSAVEEMSDRELEKIGIKRIEKKNVSREAADALEVLGIYETDGNKTEPDVYKVVRWYEGLEAN